MKTHELKTWPEPYDATAEGLKTFEFRKNDRDFNRGDTLILEEWNPVSKDYTGASLKREVNYVLYGPAFGIPEGFCIMAIV